MKNLILLLTSLLLAGAANAGVAEFTTGNTKGWQDFEVAHICAAWRVHAPRKGAHEPGGAFGRGGKDGRGHKEFGKCEHKWKIEKCARANRVINLWADSNNKDQSVDVVCGSVCPFGEKPGHRGDAIRCIPDNCPAGHVWQAQHQACVPSWELQHYCFKEHNKAFDDKTRTCQPCPEGLFPQQSGCLSQEELNAYCQKEHGTDYDATRNSCASN